MRYARSAGVRRRRDIVAQAPGCGVSAKTAHSYGSSAAGLSVNHGACTR
jgi:hypothetical protein